VGVAHRVECVPIDPEPKSFGHAKAAAVPTEQIDLVLEDSGGHTDVVRTYGLHILAM
jgi:hypothetical protein